MHSEGQNFVMKRDLSKDKCNSLFVYLPAKMECGTKPFLLRETDMGQSSHDWQCQKLLVPSAFPYWRASDIKK